MSFTTLWVYFQSTADTSLKLHASFLFPSFIQLSISCCAVLLSWFCGNGPHLRRWLVAKLSDCLLSEFPRIFLNRKVIARWSVHSLRFHLFVILIQQKRLLLHSEQISFGWEPGQKLTAPPQLLHAFSWLCTFPIKYTGLSYHTSWV